MPTGYESGKTWSPIGAQPAVSTSAASRVWTMNEVASYVSAGTWPPVLEFVFDPIATHTFDGSTASYTFTSIPQTYADLRLITKTAVSGSHSNDYHVAVQINGDTGSNYRYYYSYIYSYSTQSSGGSGASRWLVGMNFGSTTLPYTCIMDMPDYSSSDNVPAFTSRYGQTSLDTGTNAYNRTGWASGSFEGTIAAVTSLTVGTMGYGSSNYPNGTTATLYGMGTAS